MTLDSAGHPDRHGEHELLGLLRRQGINASFISSESQVQAGDYPDESASNRLALVDTTYLTSSEVKRCVTACSEAGIPVIALVPRGRIGNLEASLPITDFISSPPDPDELKLKRHIAGGVYVSKPVKKDEDT
ncbi:MAG: hypothetical protein IIB17_04320 [Chloroflexi bacterium]|nr:hypothetical protein [Chloroflexota bacterium]